jgi:hypothetical protein
MAFITLVSSLLLLLQSASAIPLTPRQIQSSLPRASAVAVVNPDTIVNSDGEVNNTASKEFICSFSSQTQSVTSPADLREIWDQTGASTFLNSYIANNTDLDWARKLSASEGDGEFFCSDISTSGLCGPTGVVSCENLRDPAWFFIRQAAANCFAFFQSLRSNNDAAAGAAGANIPQLVVDFGAPPADDDNGSFLENVFSGIFGAASSSAGLLIAADPEADAAGAVFGLLSSIFSIASAAPSGPTPSDPTAQLQAQVSAYFTAINSTLTNTVATIFGGTQNGHDPSSLPGVSPFVIPGIGVFGVTGPNGETQPIARFFDDGSKYPPSC